MTTSSVVIHGNTTNYVVRNREGYQSMMFGLTPFLLLALSLQSETVHWDTCLNVTNS